MASSSRLIYNQLPQEFKAQIKREEKVITFIEEMEQLVSAEVLALETDISKLVNKELTLDDEKLLNSIKERKNDLDLTNQKRIKNLTEIESIEKKMNVLLDKHQVELVIDAISKLPAKGEVTLENIEVVNKVLKSYNDLAYNLKNKVTNKSNLDRAKAEAEWFEVVVKMNKDISLIPPIEKITFDSEKLIRDNMNLYNKLDEKQKEMLLNASHLTKAFNRLTEIKKVSEVEMLLLRLPVADKVTLAMQERIAAARSEFEKLPKDFKPLVRYLSNLENAEKKIKELKLDLSITEVTERIDKLVADVPIKISHLDEIYEIRKITDEMTAEERAKIKNFDKLAIITEEVNKLKAKVTAFNKLTRLIPALEKITIQDEARIDTALKAYEELTEEQKTLIYEADFIKLQSAKKKVIELKSFAQIEEVVDLIKNLPEPLKLTLKDQVIVNNTFEQYKALTEKQKKDVTNREKLLQLVALIENLGMHEANAQITRVNELIEVLPDFINVDISSEKQVELITEKYNALSKEQQVHIKGYEKVAQYDQKIQMLKAKSVEVFEQIAKLPEASSVKVTDRDAIEKVRTAFSNLTAGQKNLVTNHQKLDAVEKALAQLESKTILDLVIGILALPEASVATEAVQGEVFTLRAKYNQLNKTQQSMITNYEKLVKVEEKLKNLAEINTVEAEKVITLIAKLPTTITLDQQSQIEDARSAYENLTIPQQSVVTNYEMLADAEEALLPLVAKEQKAAYKVTSMIDALPSKVTTDHEAAVNSVRKAFNGLTTSQKKLVKNEAVLVEAEKAIKKLQNIVAITSKNAKMAIPTITNLSTTVSGTASKSTKVYVYNGSKRLAYATVSKNGKYSMKIAKQKKGAKLKFVQRNSDKKVVKTTYVTVKGAKVKTPYSVKASATKVTGKASKAKTVAIYKGSKKISSVAVKSKGTFTAKITKQKKGVKLSVYAYDSVKNKSEKKVVSVK
ncbi:hypothetical protein DF281_10975 [Kurthia zopfii]|uniref:Cell wall-associated protease n=2 Tax=Kurthia zopfii TaxID=1650 RepID=A0A8B4QB73_9BACL|nr:Ig-like domain-containing protein [Kurthia zopfii]PWI21707.1 hypothetical protein DF281_10975 [Kurthia zopfii]TDR35729.1 hypothetical protein DFR61_1291 [Kurthia zopfii]STX09942.1 Cell wall-associated protease precursor [Kurthia zopfii]